MSNNYPRRSLGNGKYCYSGPNCKKHSAITAEVEKTTNINKFFGNDVEQIVVSKKVDIQSDVIGEKLLAAPLFQKVGTVEAVKVTKPTVVETIVNGDFVETVNVAQPGDYIVTNPSGEKYILKEENFLKKYIPTDNPTVFNARGLIRVIKNPYKKPVTIIAPWGAEQHGDKDCYFALNVEGDDLTDRYIIENKAFHETYARKNENKYSPADYNGLAQKFLFINDLTTQNSDYFDFREVSIKDARDMVKEVNPQLSEDEVTVLIKDKLHWGGEAVPTNSGTDFQEIAVWDIRNLLDAASK
jgi:hypothetical protein